MIKVLAFAFLIHLVSGMPENKETKVFKNGDATTTVTKFTNRNGNRLDERIVTSTIFRGKNSQQLFNNLTDAQFKGQGCSRSPCGTNAICQETLGGRPVCSCPPGHSGNPLSYCHRGECADHIECGLSQACQNGVCVNPCHGKCGTNAHCEVLNHVAQCSCPARYRGDPFSYCTPIDPEEACRPSPCGVNTKCEIINAQPTCSCLPSFVGSPLTGCRHECESDYDCHSHDYCSSFKCVKSCTQCGKGATCAGVVNHRAQCECPKGYIGSAFGECRPECYGDVDCPGSRPACFYGICKNPCDGACGVNADCNLRGLTPICSCPRDMTGDPFISCRKFVPEDLCRPNPCGTNAICTPGHDRTQRERPVCTCPPGFTGNSLTACVRGECQADNECADHRACINYQCVDPCVGKCGVNAICSPKAHLAVCTCPTGFSGDASIACRQSRSYPVARYYRNLDSQLSSNETLPVVETLPEADTLPEVTTLVVNATAPINGTEAAKE